MEKEISLTDVFAPSTDVVARDIEGELIIVPLTGGIGDLEDELYTLNETGRAIWDRLNGQNSLSRIVEELTALYEAPSGEIEKDVRGLVNELLARKILVEKGPVP
jgi:hypothetical protein